MTDVVAAIEARLDEIEAAAKAAISAGSGEWVTRYGGRVEVKDFPRETDVFDYTIVFDEGSPSDEQAAHIALNDPAAVLRTVAGLRAIVALHIEGDYGCAVCCSDWGEAMTGDNAQAEPWPCPTLLAVDAMFPATPAAASEGGAG